MKTYLEVPYEERLEAKKLRARWDAARKKWYVENIENLEPFLRWMPKHLVRPAKSKNAWAGWINIDDAHWEDSSYGDDPS
jgi:hypothetical protein